MSKEKQIESTDWLTRGMTKEEVEREKQQAIMSVDLEMCHTEFVTGVGDIYTDYDETARKMFEKGYRRQSEPISCGHEKGVEWISVEERLPEKEDDYLVYTTAGFIETDRFSVPEDKDVDGHWFELDDYVTHWMPLPEAPKMKGGE